MLQNTTVSGNKGESLMSRADRERSRATAAHQQSRFARPKKKARLKAKGDAHMANYRRLKK
jgi:hypothetical protein